MKVIKIVWIIIYIDDKNVFYGPGPKLGNANNARLQKCIEIAKKGDLGPLATFGKYMYTVQIQEYDTSSLYSNEHH